MDTITDLLNTIDSLDTPERLEATLTLEKILYMPQGERELALGLLALDLVEFLPRRGQPAMMVPAAVAC